jgi:2-dehydropantoate 2-reductase
MTIAVIEGGAMGSLFASRLVQAGRDVWIFDKNREHVEAINRDGLKITRDGMTKSCRLPATTVATDPGIVDVAVVFVKFGQTREAVVDAAAMIGPQTLIVTLQNGIGSLDIIRSLYRNPVVYGLTTLTSELVGPGRIESSFDGAGETYVWSDDDGDARSRVVQDAFGNSGLTITVAPDIRVKIWQKLVVNGCLNPFCAITNLPVGLLVDQPGMWPFLDQVVAEICAVARRHGVALETEIGGQYLRKVAAEARHHIPSMLADVRARRATEIDALNGAIADFGAATGIATPLNTMMRLLVHGIEASWNQSSGEA